MGFSITYKNLCDNGLTTYHKDGSITLTYKNLIDGGYTAYHPNGAQSITYKNHFDNGYTTYNPDGSLSITYKNLIDGGYTTYHPDGSRSITYKNLIDGGYTTYYLGNNDFEFSLFVKQYSNSPGGWLGSAVEQIINDLMVADDILTKQLKTIENECCRITATINKTEAIFGNQEVGIFLISQLYQSINDLTDAKGIIFLAKKEIKKYIEKAKI